MKRVGTMSYKNTNSISWCSLRKILVLSITVALILLDFMLPKKHVDFEIEKFTAFYPLLGAFCALLLAVLSNAIESFVLDADKDPL
jgi:hypothetical protein